MSYPIVVLKKIKRFCFQGTRAGKVAKLEDLTKSLSSNTALVKQKYNNLSLVENDVQNTLQRLTVEKFEEENEEIDKLTLVKEEDRKKFKTALIEIKEKGIRELTPISETAQRIKAHMLVTLNKAQVQKAVLLAKTKLASNAQLQLDTLQLISKEAGNINEELAGLLQELDILNDSALVTLSDLKGNPRSDKTGNEIIDTIFNKLTSLDSTERSIRKEEK